MLVKKIAQLLWNRAPKKQYYLEIGTHLLRKGVGFKIGDSIPYKPNSKSRTRTYFIANLFYDFAKNKVTHKLTKNKPK